MKENIVHFLRKAFPFLFAVGLWRMSAPIMNPAGILAIIPIFYCSFVRPISGFSLFCVLMCIAIDYKFETVCFWVAMYCLLYAINGFQNIIDLTRMDFDGLYAFMVFFGLCILIQIFTNFTFINIIHGILLYAWVCALYMPTVMLIKRVYK